MKSSFKIPMLAFILSLSLVCALAQAKAAEPKVIVPAQGKPPTNLVKQKDGHFTPYTLPSYAENAKIYVVKPGDTLWDLAKQYLGNPYLWPQIWEKNPYIQNPHWIYPGDPLLIEEPKLVEQPVVTPAPSEEKPAEAPTVSTLQKRLPAPEPKARPLTLSTKELETYYCTEVEMYGTGRISSTKLAFDTFIVGAEDEHLVRFYGTGKIVYINKGMRQNVFPGARFQILRSEGTVHNPITGKLVGYYYPELGLAKVLIAHDDNAIVEIEFSTRPIYVGDALVPFVEKTKIHRDNTHKFQRFVDDNGKPSGNIVYVNDNNKYAGSGNVVYIDIGQKSNVAAGQFATIYRIEGKFHKADEFYPETSDSNAHQKMTREFRQASDKAVNKRSIPRVVMGELVILDVFDTTAKALVLESPQFIEIGNFVQIE